MTWYLCTRPQYVFSCGRESVLWSVSPAAAKGKASTRVLQLSMPKTDHSDSNAHRWSNAAMMN